MKLLLRYISKIGLLVVLMGVFSAQGMEVLEAKCTQKLKDYLQKKSSTKSLHIGITSWHFEQLETIIESWKDIPGRVVDFTKTHPKDIPRRAHLMLSELTKSANIVAYVNQDSEMKDLGMSQKDLIDFLDGFKLFFSQKDGREEDKKYLIDATLAVQATQRGARKIIKDLEEKNEQIWANNAFLIEQVNTLTTTLANEKAQYQTLLAQKQPVVAPPKTIPFLQSILASYYKITLATTFIAGMGSMGLLCYCTKRFLG